MPELLQEYWYLLLAALLIGIAVAWWIFNASRKTRVEKDQHEPDTNGTVARRNQALIDAPPAAAAQATAMNSAPSSAPGPVSASANTDQVAAAPAAADAEAGAAVPAREAMRAVPAPIPAPTPAKAAEGADDLRKIKGVGPKLAALLQEMGVTRFAQIAAWSDADIDAIDAKLGRFQGRIRRDDWVAQASLLDAQDLAAYEERFGNT